MHSHVKVNFKLRHLVLENQNQCIVDIMFQYKQRTINITNSSKHKSKDIYYGVNSNLILTSKGTTLPQTEIWLLIGRVTYHLQCAQTNLLPFQKLGAKVSFSPDVSFFCNYFNLHICICSL